MTKKTCKITQHAKLKTFPLVFNDISILGAKLLNGYYDKFRNSFDSDAMVLWTSLSPKRRFLDINISKLIAHTDWNSSFLIFKLDKTNVVGTQKNRLTETIF